MVVHIMGKRFQNTWKVSVSMAKGHVAGFTGVRFV